jgi:hypothetical protein
LEKEAWSTLANVCICPWEKPCRQRETGKVVEGMRTAGATSISTLQGAELEDKGRAGT